MRVIVDQEKCISCGSCLAICSDVFELADSGKVRPKGSQEVAVDKYEVEIELQECIKEAVDVCPVKAIEATE